MKKVNQQKPGDDRDTMRTEYDFSGAVRGLTAARYAQGTNIVLVDPEVRDVFPMAPVLRHRDERKRSS